MTRCDVQASGAIELYFYDELDRAARAGVEDHVRECTECAHALEELRVIRTALGSRPDVSAPASGDWSGFMARLGAAVEREGRTRPVAAFATQPARRPFVAYVAMAALLALVTVGVTVALRVRHVHSVETIASAPDTARAQGNDRVGLLPTAPGKPDVSDVDSSDFAALSEEHFERSKLVVLGLATKDPADRRASDWAYERELASSLLNDTRMYRLAAEDRGLVHIAGVMRDLEIVLLQTSMTDEKDPAALPQIQRLIQKRDLLEKMDAVAVPPADRPMATKGI
jgi:hypothetical protein